MIYGVLGVSWVGEGGNKERLWGIGVFFGIKSWCLIRFRKSDKELMFN